MNPIFPNLPYNHSEARPGPPPTPPGAQPAPETVHWPQLVEMVQKVLDQQRRILELLETSASPI